MNVAWVPITCDDGTESFNGYNLLAFCASKKAADTLQKVGSLFGNAAFYWIKI